MTDYRELARNAHGYGQGFVDRSEVISGLINIPADWLLAIIAWETGNYQASGPPWNSRNKTDNGGGIIGFTGADGGTWERMTPTEQLDLLLPYFRRWMTEYNITRFRSPIEAYWIVTGPWGMLMSPEDSVGGGRNRQWIVDTMLRVFRTNGIAWSDPTAGMEGLWNVRIGDWLGQFVFLASGDVYWQQVPRVSLDAARRGVPIAEPETAISDRKYGHWVINDDAIRWRFGPRTDIRRFEVALPVPPLGSKWTGTIHPAGQGWFKMWRGSIGDEPT